jgi:hypothetical protein
MSDENSIENLMQEHVKAMILVDKALAKANLIKNPDEQLLFMEEIKGILERYSNKLESIK